MRKYFNFYDPLEKRYIFNNFLVICALVEVLILVFTCIWQMDEGMFGGPVQVIPFPWKAYLTAAFTAPIALIFLFGVIVRGFEMISRQEGAGDEERAKVRKRARRRLLWGVAAVVAALVLIWAAFGFTWITNAVKVLGLGGAYLLIALVAVALLYFPLRLLLRYRLEKKALEYQYLLTVAERYGVILTEGKKLPPDVARALEEKKKASARASLPAPEEFPEKPDSN